MCTPPEFASVLSEPHIAVSQASSSSEQADATGLSDSANDTKFQSGSGGVRTHA